MKRILFLIMTLVIFITGCSKLITNEEEGQMSNYKSINEFINNLDTYAAVTNITYISNDNKNTYKTLQYCRKTGEYRTEIINPDNVTGNITMFDGKIIYQYNPSVSDSIQITSQETSERSEIFLTSFIKNYAMSKEVSVSVSNFDNNEFTVIEAIIPGNHPYMSNEKLWINNDTLLPKKLVVYDYNQIERIIVEFEEFVFNPILEDKIFSVEGQ